MPVTEDNNAKLIITMKCNYTKIKCKYKFIDLKSIACNLEFMQSRKFLIAVYCLIFYQIFLCNIRNEEAFYIALISI